MSAMQLEDAQPKTLPKPSPNAALIAALGQDPYFLYMIEQEAQERTRKHLELWWKIIAGVSAFILLALSAFGIYTAGDLSTKKKDLDTQITKVNTAAAEAIDSKKSIDNSKTEIDRNVGESGRLVKEAKGLIIDTKNDLKQEINSLFERYNHTQEKFEAENKKTLDENKAVTTEATTAVNSVNGSLSLADTKIKDMKNAEIAFKKKTDQILTEFEERAVEIYAKLRKIELSGEQAKQLETLKLELRKAKIFNFVMLQSNDTKRIEILDPLDLQNRIGLKFSTGRLGSRFDLRVEDTADGSTFKDYTNLSQGDIQPIDFLKHKGFAFEVVALRHRFLTHDFAMLKIFLPEDGVFSSIPKPGQ